MDIDHAYAELCDGRTVGYCADCDRHNGCSVWWCEKDQMHIIPTEQDTCPKCGTELEEYNCDGCMIYIGEMT